VSIFVNPTQFETAGAWEGYPRTMAADLAACEAAGVSAVFAPEPAEMYPMGEATRVSVAGLTEPMCGRTRPGHFEGVATVVTKLLNAVGPCVAAFGRKDYQQLAVIRRLVKDLLLPVEILGVATQREQDGLARSSRNTLLSAEARNRAAAIPTALRVLLTAYEAGERRPQALMAPLREVLAHASDALFYAELRDADSLADYEGLARIPDRAVVAVAANFGGVRLIDNVVLSEDRL
jgi:pantoate--beta-alanine ligase